MRLIPLIRLLTKASKGKVSAEEFLGELGEDAPTLIRIGEGGRPSWVGGGEIDEGTPMGILKSGDTVEEALVAYLDAVVRDVASAALAPLIKATAATLSAALLSILMERRRGEG